MTKINMMTPYLTSPIIKKIIKAATTLVTENVPTPTSHSIIGPIAAAIVTEAIRDHVFRGILLEKD